MDSAAKALAEVRASLDGARRDAVRRAVDATILEHSAVATSSGPNTASTFTVVGAAVAARASFAPRLLPRPSAFLSAPPRQAPSLPAAPRADAPPLLPRAAAAPPVGAIRPAAARPVSAPAAAAPSAATPHGHSRPTAAVTAEEPERSGQLPSGPPSPDLAGHAQANDTHCGARSSGSSPDGGLGLSLAEEVKRLSAQLHVSARAAHR